MDEVRIVKHRTHMWPVIIALIVLALVIGLRAVAMDRARRSGGMEQASGHRPAAGKRTGSDAGRLRFRCKSRSPPGPDRYMPTR